MSKKDKDKRVKVGKKSQEHVSSYKEFLKKPDKSIDKTDVLQSNIDYTESEKPDYHSKELDTRVEVSKVPLSYKAKTFAEENWKQGLFIGVIGGILVSLLFSFSSANREIGEIKADLKNYEKHIENLQSKYEKTYDKSTQNEQELKIMRIEIENDLQYLEKQIEDIMKE